MVIKFFLHALRLGGWGGWGGGGGKVILANDSKESTVKVLENSSLLLLEYIT